MMPGSRSGACIAVAGAFWLSAALADDKTPESVLAEKGLVRQGKVYLLPQVEEAIQSLGIDNMKLEMSKMRTMVDLRAMERMGSAMDIAPRGGPGGGMPPPNNGFPPPDDGPPPPPPDGQPGFGGPGFPGRNAPLSPQQRQQMDRLSRLSDQEMIKSLIERKAGIEGLQVRERQAANHALFLRLVGQYDQIAADPKVKAALKAVNKGRDVKYAVGPPPMYESRLIAAAAETLGDKGLRINKGHNTFSTAIDDDLARGVAEAEKAKAQLQSAEKATARAEAKLAEALHRKPGSLSAGAEPTAQVKALAEEPMRLQAEAAAAREQFIKLIRDLPRRAQDAQRRRKELGDDPEVKEALADLDRYRSARPKHKIVVGKKFDESVKHLTALGSMVETRTIDLEPDRDRLLVGATLNDAPSRKMAVDPKVPLVRLSARDAAAVLVKLDDALPIDVAGEDGRTFRARRATLKSLRVGEFTAHDVVCVVMPETFGDAPPVLGASFLNQFVAELDPSAGRLRLTQVGAQPPKP